MRNKSVKKSPLGVICAASILCLCANAGLAGEITGNGESLKNPDGTLNGRSECAFSGLNDNFFGDGPLPDADGFFRVQNWGHLPKAVKDFLRSINGHPGGSCSPGAPD
ncbi:MAG TPA: hypothetical protein VFG91_02480 [Woeseiaceae bacterium]|nr:hypothetical protein [Woeseiaceae bacterium]